ncbi:hypothetical protein BOTBODRAFT_108857 [Botryobasidium botryosum FD-172 SS1]|uniref:Uncharacterized protein n=1 Tax=Botryobasidium botryosum (strain FD-172 SS1) TaxID=930990 RepID=A0A067MKK9_BOTB1|nr:hypothetical protein BOTBODRAFT_108857 [Botryobasidium botryosum FD-172 SS1]
MLTHTIMAGEESRVHLFELDRLKSKRNLTLMVDGWDDRLRRSVYGVVTMQRGDFPSVLGLHDLTGSRASAEAIVDVVNKGINTMEIDVRRIIGAVTDDPTPMRLARRKLEEQYPWILTYPCILHKLNTIIGKMLAFPAMKNVIRQNAKIVSFFNGSHYWGGQLHTTATCLGVNQTLKTHTDSQWYSLVKQALSISEHRVALRQLCEHPDAQRKVGNFSPVSKDVLQTILRDLNHWDAVAHLLQYCKPLVDAIGNLESREASLADCLLELLRCAQTIIGIPVEENDVPGFSAHAKCVFNAEFHKINTNLMFLVLFLHPFCRNLAISQAARSRTLHDIYRIALDIVRKWGWDENQATMLLRDLKDYYQGKAPFTGSAADGKKWWEELPISAPDHPILSLALIVFDLVPHSAEVERLFSNLGGIQSAKRSNLSVDMLQSLGKLRNHYAYLLGERAQSLGQSTHRKHSHMHTRDGDGINTALVGHLLATFTARDKDGASELCDEERCGDVEDITLDDIDKAFTAVCSLFGPCTFTHIWRNSPPKL